MESTEWLKAKEAAEYFGVSPSTLYRMWRASKGTMPRHYLSLRTFRYKKSELDKYRETQGIGIWEDKEGGK